MRGAPHALTAITLILLTFTVLSFTSVKTYLRENKIVLGDRPAYQGIMLRDRSWLSLEAPTAEIIANELRGQAVVAPRAWYSSADLEKELMVDIALAGDLSKTYTVNAILGLSPQETQVMDTERLLLAGRWFRPGEKNTILLPQSIADALGIGPADLGTAKVKLFGRDFIVVGVLDEARMREQADLDGEPMTPVNYSQLRPEVIEELKRQAERRSQLGSSGASSLLQEARLRPENIAVIPATPCSRWAAPRVRWGRFEQPEQVAKMVTTMMKRFAPSLYAGVGNQRFVCRWHTSASGLECGHPHPDRGPDRAYHAGRSLRAHHEIGIQPLGLAPVHIGIVPGRGLGVRQSGRDRGLPTGTGAGQGDPRLRPQPGHRAELLLDVGGRCDHPRGHRGATVHDLPQ